MLQWKKRVSSTVMSFKELSGSLQEPGFMAVSYTHLDVYKRQLEGRLTAQEAAVALGLDAGTIGACEPLPASVHVFSHVEWHMGGYRFRIGTGGPKGYLMADKNEIFDAYSVPEAFRAYKRLIFEESGKVET